MFEETSSGISISKQVHTTQKLTNTHNKFPYTYKETEIFQSGGTSMTKKDHSIILQRVDMKTHFVKTKGHFNQIQDILHFLKH